jgi:hypothetical protein
MISAWSKSIVATKDAAVPAQAEPALIVPTVATPAKWSVSEEENELDHSRRLSLRGQGGQGMVLRGQPRFEGYVMPPLPDLIHRLDAEDGHRQRVRFRIDSGPLRTESWAVSDDFEASLNPGAIDIGAIDIGAI